MWPENVCAVVEYLTWGKKEVSSGFGTNLWPSSLQVLEHHFAIVNLVKFEHCLSFCEHCRHSCILPHWLQGRGQCCHWTLFSSKLNFLRNRFSKKYLFNLNSKRELTHQRQISIKSSIDISKNQSDRGWNTRLLLLTMNVCRHPQQCRYRKQ